MIAVDSDSRGIRAHSAAGWPRRFQVQGAPALQPPPRPYSVSTGPAWVSIQGGLVFEPTQPPLVTLDGLPVELSSTCSPGDVVSCVGTEFWLPQSTSAGAHQVQVDYRNGCASSVSIQVAPRPVVTSWSPAISCGRWSPPPVRDGLRGPGECLRPAGLWMQASCELAGTTPCRDILITDPPLMRGDLQVTVVSDTAPRSSSAPVSIPSWTPAWSGPLVPRLVAAGDSHVLTVPDIEQLTGGVTDVTVAPVNPSAGVPPISGLPFQYELYGITFTLPGTLPPGDYVVRVTDEGPCPMVVPGLVVAASKVLPLADFEEGLGWSMTSPGSHAGARVGRRRGASGGRAALFRERGPGPREHLPVSTSALRRSGSRAGPTGPQVRRHRGSASGSPRSSSTASSTISRPRWDRPGRR